MKRRVLGAVVSVLVLFCMVTQPVASAKAAKWTWRGVVACGHGFASMLDKLATK